MSTQEGLSFEEKLAISNYKRYAERHLPQVKTLSELYKFNLIIYDH